MSLFHVGVVVADLDRAKARLTELIGVSWGPSVDLTRLELRDRTGDIVLPNRICYSTTPPHLELIQEQPGTVWVCNDYSNLHHIGYFADRFADGVRHMQSLACPLELCDRRGGAAPATFAYYRDGLGIRIEMVDSERRSVLHERYFRALEPQ